MEHLGGENVFAGGQEREFGSLGALKPADSNPSEGREWDLG